MTRAELYSLVWERPMVHVANQFGISDVGLRKICVKHNIPTPPLGYWAKVAHGKKVRRPVLPPLNKDVRDHVPLAVRTTVQLPEFAATAELVAEAFEGKAENNIVAPRQRPAKLHPHAAAIEKALRRAKPDHEGFVDCGSELINARVGQASIERAILLIDTFAKALPARGYAFELRGTRLNIVADGEPFALEVSETRDRIQHKPTSHDLKAQAEYDERRARLPQFYSVRQVWPKWDYIPSGRVCFVISDPTQYEWNGANILGRWYDRGGKKVEEYLGSAMVALARGSALAKHRRAEAEEKARHKVEEAERRRLEEARRDRIKKRREFILQKSDDYSRLSALTAFQNFLASKATKDGSDPIDRIAREVDIFVMDMAQKFERETLNSEIGRFGLFADGDPF